MLSIWTRLKICHLVKSWVTLYYTIQTFNDLDKEAFLKHFQQFRVFPQCFPKAFFLNVLKLVYMEERVNLLSANTLNSDRRKFCSLFTLYDTIWIINEADNKAF